MADVMKKIREELANLNKEPTLSPETNINNGLKLQPQENHSVMNFQQKTEKPPTESGQPDSFSASAKKMEEIMKKIREDLNKDKVTKDNTLPGIQSFNIENAVPTTIPVAQGVESSDKPESMIEIMKKIREDLENTNKETNTETSDVFHTIQTIRKDPNIQEKPNSLPTSITQPIITFEEETFPIGIPQTLNSNNSL